MKRIDSAVLPIVIASGPTKRIWSISAATDSLPGTMSAADKEKLDKIVSGTYTPVLDETANITSSVNFVAQYMRVNDVVTVSGRVTLTLTAGAVLAKLRMTLPIESSIDAIREVAGTAVSSDVAGLCGRITADLGTQIAELQILTADFGSARDYSYHYTYLIVPGV